MSIRISTESSISRVLFSAARENDAGRNEGDSAELWSETPLLLLVNSSEWPGLAVVFDHLRICTRCENGECCKAYFDRGF